MTLRIALAIAAITALCLAVAVMASALLADLMELAVTGASPRWLLGIAVALVVVLVWMARRGRAAAERDFTGFDRNR